MSPTLRPDLLVAVHRAMLVQDRRIVAGPLPDEVVRYWRDKRLRPSFAYQDVWREEHDVAFTAAKVMRIDVLDALSDELDRAIVDGVPYKQWQKEVKPRLEKLGWWAPHEVTDPETGDVARVDPPKRLKLIYDTNLRTAHAVGQYLRVQEQQERFPFLLYQVGPSARHREQHLAWHGLLLPVSDPFWEFAWPPNGWNCRCSVRSVAAREHKQLVRDGIIEGRPEPVLDDDGLPTGHVKQKRAPVQTKAPLVPMVAWQNKRTGKTEFVPEGIDPGFDKTPGEGRRQIVEEQKRKVRQARKKR